MNEEQDIIRKCGKRNPFHVPEGYFEDFTQRLMDQLPEQEEVQPDEEQITLWQRVKPVLYMAAMFVGMILCARFFLGGYLSENLPSQSIAESTLPYDYEEITDEEISALVEYTMMDNYTLYQYLTEVE